MLGWGMDLANRNPKQSHERESKAVVWVAEFGASLRRIPPLVDLRNKKLSVHHRVAKKGNNVCG